MGAASFMAIGGGALGAYGSITMAKAQARAAKYNAVIARQNGVLARKQAKANAKLVREDGFKSLGSIRASVGASGLTMEGSFSDIMVESARNVKRDEMNTIYQGELQARGFEIEARQASFQGRMAKVAGMFGAASSLIGAGAQASSYSNLGGGGAKPTPKRAG